MRLLSCRQVIRYVREHGIAQFISLYKRVKDIENDELLWGDEVSVGVISSCDSVCVWGGR